MLFVLERNEKCGRMVLLSSPPRPPPAPPRPVGQSQQGRDSRVPLTPAQKREVDDAFDLFDYAKTGTLDLHEVKVGVLYFRCDKPQLYNAYTSI